MANEVAQLWLTTEIETIETTEVVRGGRGGGDIGGGYGQPRVTLIRSRRLCGSGCRWTRSRSNK